MAEKEINPKNGFFSDQKFLKKSEQFYRKLIMPEKIVSYKGGLL